MKTLLILVLVASVALPAPAIGFWDRYLSQVECAYEGTEHVTILNFPDGTGFSFQEARDSNGELVDATITLYLRDTNNDPIAGFPCEDIWLQSEDGGLFICFWGNWGTNPDADTDMNGMTQWVNPLCVGGSSQAPLEVLVNGLSILNPPNLPISFNSPDLNRDGHVNLIDLGYFSADYFGEYNFQSDFHCDGQINLADVARYAEGSGAHCP